MVDSFLKGLGLCFLGLFLWVIFSFVAAFSPSGYGSHVIMGLSFTLMIFGPVLFWIVFPFKERWYDKGKKKRFYAIIAPIGLIFLIFLGVAFSPPTPPPAPAGVTVTTGEVIDHNLATSVKVTFEGKRDFYSISMTGPEGTEVNSAFITETQMADGKQSVWMELVGEYGSEVAAKPGTYSIVATDSLGNKVYEKNFGPYSGANLSVINISSITTSYKRYWGYNIDEITLTIKNDGDLPAYISRVDIEVDTEEGEFLILREEEVILPGEKATITASEEFIYLDQLYEGNYSASIKLREGDMGGGGTVATYTTIISIP